MNKKLTVKKVGKIIACVCVGVPALVMLYLFLLFCFLPFGNMSLSFIISTMIVGAIIAFIAYKWKPQKMGNRK